MRGDRVFIDSNILLYQRDIELREKGEVAAEWLRRLTRADVACANLQVLNEVTSVMLRRWAHLDTQAVFAAVDELAYLGRDPISETTVSHARRLRLATRYSWWDCLLLASALELGCRWFLSEDLQDGHEIEGLTIVDPFAHSPAQLPIS